MREKKRETPPPTLEQLRQYEAEYMATRKRQHGKARKIFDNEKDEYRQLYNNWASRCARKRKRDLIASKEKHFRSFWGVYAEDADEYGIRPVDERRYKGCFRSGWIGMSISRDYIRRMTGLTLKQISILQQRTGLLPTPPVSIKEADLDEQRRYESGDIY